MQNIKSRLTVLYSGFSKATLRSKVITIIVVLAVIGIPMYLLIGKKQQTPQYQTAQAKKETLVTSVTASGTVAAGNSVSVTTSATGIVNQVYVKQGDTVTQGEKLADITLDQDSLQRQTEALANYQSAQNNLNAAQSKMNSLQSDLFKANQTFVNDAGTPNPDTADPKYIEEKADWQQAEADYTNQSGVISQAQTALTSAWMSYQQISSTITAPATGTLTSFILTPGLPIGSSGGELGSGSSNSSSSNASSSQTLGTVTLPGGQLEAVVELSEVDVTKVHPGQRVTMTLDAFPGKTFTGHVSSIDTTGSVSSGVTTYPTEITFDSAPSNIYSNMGVDATIITDIKDNALTVPTTAVQTANGQSTVRVLKNGQIRNVDVTTGESSDIDTQILSGLNDGDTVVIGVASTSVGTRTTSPFGGGGFGGARGGFGGGGNAVFRARGG